MGVNVIPLRVSQDEINLILAFKRISTTSWALVNRNLRYR